MSLAPRPWLALALLCSLLLVTAAQEPAAVPPSSATDPTKDLSAVAFLKLVRRPPVQDSWARLRGEVTAQAEGKTVKLPIDFRARFAPDLLRAQVQLNDHERYIVQQVFADGMAGTSVITEQEPLAGARSLADVGLRPGDLTLSFLYWDFMAELEPATIRGQDCRIFRLQHPQAKEQAVVAIATRFLFPLRVEWYQANAKEPYRRLEFTNFKRDDDVWIVNEAVISNTGWRTKVLFSEVEIHRITAGAPPPADLFLGAAPPPGAPTGAAISTKVTPPAPAPNAPPPPGETQP